MMSHRWRGDVHASASQNGPYNRARLRSKLPERTIAMDPVVQVNLSQRQKAGTTDNVDEQSHVNPVVRRQRQRIDERSANRAFSSERLAKLRQLWEKSFEERSRRQLSHPATLSNDSAQRSTVGGLDEGNAAIAEDGAEKAENKIGREVDHVGIEEDDYVPFANCKGSGHRGSLAGPGFGRKLCRYDKGTRPGRHCRGRIGGAIIDDDDLVHQVCRSISFVRIMPMI